MSRRALNSGLSVLGWLVHLAGVGCLVTGLATAAAILYLDLPTAYRHIIFTYHRGIDHIYAGVENDGVITVGVGEIRSQARTSAGDLVGYTFVFGRTIWRDPGWVQVAHHRSPQLLPDGRAVREYATYYVRWQFIAFVGLVLSLLPLAVGSPRRSIFSFYRGVGRPLARAFSFVTSRTGQQRRGFEVLTR